MADANPIAELLRDRLLTFDPTGSDGTLSARLGGRLYWRRAPNNTAFPYAVFRIQNDTESGDDGGHRTRAELEIIFFARNASDFAAITRCAAIAREAFTRWNYTDPNGAGVLTMRPGATIGDADGTESPADAELFIVRAVFPFTAWPSNLMQYTTGVP